VQRFDTLSDRVPLVGLDPADEHLRVLRLVGVLGVRRQFFEQLLAVANVRKSDLDV